MTNLEPNQYALSGKHLKLTYSNSGIQGQPSLSYQDGHQTLDFHGGQIRVADTEIGKLVSVNIKESVDTGPTSFSFLIPVIELSSVGSDQTFETMGIKTAHKTSLVLPSTGLREVYEFHNLNGTARIVEFLATQLSSGA